MSAPVMLTDINLHFTVIEHIVTRIIYNSSSIPLEQFDEQNRCHMIKIKILPQFCLNGTYYLLGGMIHYITWTY
jgi:hypothetical protein